MRTDGAAVVAGGGVPLRTSRLAGGLFLLLAFSVLGTLFALPRPTLVTSVLVVLAFVAAIAVKTIRESVGQSLLHDDRRWIAWPFVAWLVCHVVVASAAGAPESLSFYDNAFRFVLALSILGLAAPVQSRRWFLWSLPVAAFCAALHGVSGMLDPGRFAGRAFGWTNHPIYFGNLAALVMLLSLSAALLGRTLSTGLRFILCCTAVFAMFAALSSVTRSSGLLLVCVVPLLLWTKKDRFHRAAAAGIAILVASSVILALTSPSVRQSIRLTELKNDVVQAGDRNFNTSAGARIQMWRGALLIFKDHPIAGIGPGKFEGELKRLIAEKKLLPMETFNQPHSDWARAASFGGILMLLAYSAILGGPLIYFLGQMRRSLPGDTPNLAALLGMQVVAAYFLFGLTNAAFGQQIYSTTYAILICVLGQMAHRSSMRAALPDEPGSSGTAPARWA